MINALAKLLSFVLGISFLSCSVAADQITVLQTNEKATIENSRIQIEFDLARGTYCAVDKRDGSVGFQEGCVRVGDWNSTQEGTVCRAADRADANGLGEGRTLAVECARPGQPTLLLEISLYTNTCFAVLRSGIVNTTEKSIRLKEFYPLTAACALPENAEFRQAKTLNAEGGGRDTFVQAGTARASSNNVLATFLDGNRRRTLVLGGLTYHEWMKSAATWPTAAAPTGNAVRWKELNARIDAAGGNIVAYLDCGGEPSAEKAAGVHLRALTGKPFDFASVFAAPCFNTVLFDDKQIELEADGLNPQKSYLLGFSWWDYSTENRVESVYLTPGDGTVKTALVKKSRLPAYARVREQLPEEKIFAIPQAMYASGKMKIAFALDSAAPGSNAVVSEAWIIEGPPELAAKTISPASPNFNKVPEKEIYLHLKASDPVGRRVDPGEKYLPEDRFYVDFATDDPFAAAEQYGLAIRTAQQAKPNPYTFPTICSWYAGVTFEPEAQNHPEKSRYGIATTAGQVGEMDFIRTTGFLKYSTIALRLVPDNYTPNNPQGWWDDKHWQEQGFYTAPYETSEKWGQAVQARGGLAITYFQSDRVSADFRKAHPELLLPGNRAFDYTKPETQKYLCGVYAAMKGHIAGMMFDYCDELWCFNLAPGGFHDDRATAASVYRIVFGMAKQGLGPRSWLHERPIDNPGSDMAVGLIDSQRTSGDTALISHKLASRSGVRWYKNRVLFAYDMDSKSLLNAWKDDSFKGTDEDGRRMTLTMCYVVASRLLLANSLRDLSSEALHDLERVVPFPTEPRSHRPIDAFSAEGLPTVYDFAVNADWHQLTLLNADGAKEATLTVPLHGEVASGCLGLDAKAEYYFYDFWNDTYAGKLSGGERLKQTLRAGEARTLSIHRVENRPQFLSTNRHLMQGYLDMAKTPEWDVEKNTLDGVSKVIGGAAYQIVVAGNGYQPKSVEAPKAKAKIEPIAGSEGLFRVMLESPENAEIAWSVVF